MVFGGFAKRYIARYILQDNSHAFTDAVEMIDALSKNKNWVTEKTLKLRGLNDPDKVSFKLLVRENTYKHQYRRQLHLNYNHPYTL